MTRRRTSRRARHAQALRGLGWCVAAGAAWMALGVADVQDRGLGLFLSAALTVALIFDKKGTNR
jgi:hypothetical protein